jgi:5,10-methylenetetrahydrofolate reductase
MWLEADAEASAWSALAGVLPLALTDREGHPDPVAAGVKVLRRTGIQPLVHLARRTAAVGDAVAAAGLSHLLLMEGVPDTAALVRALAARLPRAGLGVVVNPFVDGERELERLHAKAEAGATFYVAQAGFDDGVYQGLLERGPKIPALASVLCIGPRLARSLVRGEVPGVHLPADLARRIGNEGGGEAPIRRLAAQIRSLRTMGFAGVHIAGIRRPETARRLLALL